MVILIYFLISAENYYQFGDSLVQVYLWSKWICVMLKCATVKSLNEKG